MSDTPKSKICAKIYRPAKKAMQSGPSGRSNWLVEVIPNTPNTPEQLMGWTTGEDTMKQISLRFETRESALDYINKRGWLPIFVPEQNKKIRPQNYSSKFMK